MYEDRIEKARELFMSGYNCSQSVVGAFADLFGFTEEQGLKMSASFGAGIGRMRLTCGAACGMFLLAGLDTGAVKGEDSEGKAHNYEVVQRLAKEFERATGELICAKLLDLDPSAPITTRPEARTDDYYKKRPCVKVIETAARIFANYLTEREKEKA